MSEYDDYPLSTPPVQVRTSTDDVRKMLRTALGNFPAYPDGCALPLRVQARLLDYLTPKVMEEIDHAVQMARIDRGVLPYDED